MTERALAIGNAALYAKDFDDDFLVVRMEQGDRKAVKFVPVPGHLITERFTSHDIVLHSGSTTDAQDFIVDAYDVITALNKNVDLEPFNAWACTIEIVVKVKVTSGDTAYIRIKDEDGNIVGAEQNTTETSYETLTFSWTEANVNDDTFKIDAYVDAGQGTVYVESITIKDAYARPTVENSSVSSAAALTVSLDTKGYPFVSYMYDTDDTATITFEVSDDNVNWYIATTHSPSGAEVAVTNVTCGFRYVRLVSATAKTFIFKLSAKR